MKLSHAHDLSLVESTFVQPLPVLNEDGEGPRWSFNYDSYKNDPSPDILVLGAYTHPTSGNNLIGGINLNYLDKAARDDLARVLPQLMQGTNLYQRYHLGKNLLPGVFDNFYRTYKAQNIRGVNQSVFHPKYGMMQATKDFLKKKIGGLFKSKAQRAADAEPKFPSDLSGMKDALDNAVTQLGLQIATGEEEADTPEMKAARQNFMQFKMDRAKSMMDIERDEDQPLIQATQNFQQTQLQGGQATPQQVSPQAAQTVQQYQSTPTPPPREMTPQQMGQTIEQERYENQQELANPNNSLDLDGDGVPDDQQAAPPQLDQETQGYFDELDRLNEAVVYFCPKLRRYIIEDLGEAIKETILEWDLQPGEEEIVDEPVKTLWRDCTPDTIWKSDPSAITFVYTADGILYYLPDGVTHEDLFQMNDDLTDRYNALPGRRPMRDKAERVDLIGRAGKVGMLGITAVSFWNTDKAIYDGLLKDCLEALIYEGFIDSNYMVSTPHTGVVTQDEIMGKSPPAQEVDQDEVDLHRRLHLMRGDEKKAAMKKLGVGVGGRPHPMATAMGNAGLLKPGQKWWAPHSEGVLREPGTNRPRS